MKKRLSAVLMSAIMMLSLLPTVFAAETSKGVGTEEHTQEEIRQFILKNKSATGTGITYVSEPNLNPGNYAPGQLSDASLNAGLKMLQNIRYVAGLDTDLVLDPEYCEYAQAAALVNAANNNLEHYPSRPSGMSEEMYQKGRTGASSSNLYMGNVDSMSRPVLSWMDDDGDNNLSTVGHRRWQLLPGLYKIGFGAVGRIAAGYVFGERKESSVTGVAWPARNMPTEYFYYKNPWSFSTGSSEDIGTVKVTLTDQKNGKKWIFRQGCDSNASDSGYFTVNNAGYGQSGAIIFRPNGITCSDGDSYHVSITGATREIEYDVRFFHAEEKHGVNCASAKYNDVPRQEGHWAHLAIDYVLEKGYMAGMDDVTFSPNTAVSRAQICQILYAMEGKPGAGKTLFQDVPSGQWYTDAVSWAADNGLVSGYGKGRFGPDDSVTREQLVLVMYQYAKLKGYRTDGKADLAGYADYKKVSRWSETAVSWAVANKVITGTELGIEPQGTATRAQIAVILRAFDLNIRA